MRLRTGIPWLSPTEKLSSHLKALAQQDLFAQTKPYDKILATSALDLFRLAKFDTDIYDVVKSPTAIHLALKIDNHKIQIEILPSQGRIPPLDKMTCSCGQIEPCVHTVALNILLWACAQSKVHRERKYGFTEANREASFQLKNKLYREIINEAEASLKSANEAVQPSPTTHITTQVKLRGILICGSSNDPSTIASTATTGQTSKNVTRIPQSVPAHGPNLLEAETKQLRAIMTLDLFFRSDLDIQYWFEDNVFVSARDVIHHSYRQFIPRRLMPILERDDFFLSFVPRAQLTVNQSRHEATLLKIVDSAFREKQRSDFEIVASTSSDRSQPSDGTVIDEVTFIPLIKEKWNAKDQFRLHVSLTSSSLEQGTGIIGRLAVGPEGSRPLSTSCIVKHDSKVLYIHPFGQLVDFFWSERSSQSWTGEKQVSGAEALGTWLRVLPSLLPEGWNTKDVVSVPKFQTQWKNPRRILRIDPSGVGFATTYEGEHALCIRNLPQLSLDVMKGIRHGLREVEVFKRLRPADFDLDLRAFDIRFLSSSTAFARMVELLIKQVAKTESEVSEMVWADWTQMFIKADSTNVAVRERLGSKIAAIVDAAVRDLHFILHQSTALSWNQSLFNADECRTFMLDFFRTLFAKIEKKDPTSFWNPNPVVFADWTFVEQPPLTIGNFRLEESVALSTASSQNDILFQFGPAIMKSWPIASWFSMAQELDARMEFQGRTVVSVNENDLSAAFQIIEKEPPPASSDSAGMTIDNRGHTLDWFELDPRFFLDGKELTESQSYQLYRDGYLEFNGKLFIINQRDLPHVRSLEIFWKTLSAGRIPTEDGPKNQKRVFPLARHQVLDLLTLRAQGIQVQGGKRWGAICEFFDSLSTARDTFETSEKFKGELKPYQCIGTQWLADLYRLSLGGILADDMGLGKTIQALAFFDWLYAQGQLGQCLIVVPATLIFNWESEIKKFTPEIPVCTLASLTWNEARQSLRDKDEGLYLCTYNFLNDYREELAQHVWNVIIFDEAQALKTLTSRRTQAAREIVARFKMSLTGTPLENHFGEAFSLLDLSVPGSLGSYAEFRKSYMSMSDDVPPDVRLLKEKMRPLVLRRTKKDILHELPAKTEIVIEVPFENQQKEIYRDIALSWNSKVRQSITEMGEARSQLLMITALLRLRQVCSDPRGLPEIQYDTTPPKISLLMDSLEEVLDSGDSAVVFTQFLATYNRVIAALQSRGVPCFGLNGSMNRMQKEEAITGFGTFSKGAVMVATLKTGGVGLNLTKASYVFHLEPWWNPAVENQATDRTHRIGQTKPVTVYRYIMKDSIEQKIEILKERKLAHFDALFSLESSDLSQFTSGDSLSQDDFRFLLGEFGSEMAPPQIER